MLESKKKEFKDGQDKIGDVECWDATEYWNTFLTQEIWSETEKYDLSSFNKELQEAELFFLHFLPQGSIR